MNLTLQDQVMILTSQSQVAMTQRLNEATFILLNWDQNDTFQTRITLSDYMTSF